ncbi:MAG: hypothetical protein H8F28_10225 [Fibrella sp.]|nr:hypothetical protein [Armatimonadota bacterium]
MTAYEVSLTDRAEEDLDKLYFSLQTRIGYEKAFLWYGAIREAIIRSLESLPHRYQVSEDGSKAYPGTEVRAMRYGQGAAVFRIYYFIIEPRSEENEVDGAVRVLRVRHVTMRPLSQYGEDDE